MKILVDDLLKDFPYSKSYFLKILTNAQVKSRFLLDKEDLENILKSVSPFNGYKAYNLHLKINDILKEFTS